MGISIVIGEEVLEPYTEGFISVEVDVERRRYPINKVGDQTLDRHTNRIYFNYIGFIVFLERCGLYDLFNNEYTGLVGTHPGACYITQKHLDTIREAKNTLKIRDEDDKNIYKDLQFFERQFEYALKNCKVPIIINY